MGLPVIPAPARWEGGPGRFVVRPGAVVAYAGAGFAAIAERFCSEMARRTGLRLVPVAGDPVAGVPSVRIGAAGVGELAGLPAPLGLSPAGGSAPDERYSLVVDAGQVTVRAATPAGAARGLTTLTQLLATADGGGAGEVVLPGARILDAPRYAWRGLSLDLARTFFTPGEVRRVIDLLALYKLNVLHLHLTDDQSWRLPVGRPAGPGGAFYGAGDLRALAAYAADRFVTVVPEVDTPGHAAALMGLHPELVTGRNRVEFELPPGQVHRTGWLDPELPATFELIEEVLAGVAGIFPGPYLHIGGDEPFGMPHDLYVSYVSRVRDIVRSAGRRPLGWQESARAGLGADDVIQYWLADVAVPASLAPEARARLDADLAMSRRDLETVAAASVPVIVSPLRHCYLDVPYGEPSADPAQADRQGRVGLRVYAPTTVAETFGWEPAETLGPGRAGQVAGVEAAIWAETIAGFDDLTFLLLPRLPGVAHRAWAAPQTATGAGPQAVTWADHRDSLARHGRLWAQDGLTYFRAASVDWR
jgi:hexosaminidase